jgi:hypothetical protein
MIAFEFILKTNGILDKDKKFKSLKEMTHSNEKWKQIGGGHMRKNFFSKINLVR